MFIMKTTQLFSGGGDKMVFVETTGTAATFPRGFSSPKKVAKKPATSKIRDPKSHLGMYKIPVNNGIN